jgi:GNAT superfamily N-acetyltransferase
MMSQNMDEVKIIQITDPIQLNPYLSALAVAYQSVFSSPPYNEQFYPAEVQDILIRHINTPYQITLLAMHHDEIIGFGLASPLRSYPEVTRQLRGLLPIRHTYYFTELGVQKRWRRKGIGRALTEKRLDLVDRSRYQHIVLRTSDNKDAAYLMYTNMEFEDMGVYTEISSRRVDGSIRTDRRLFLSRLIDQS